MAAIRIVGRVLSVTPVAGAYAITLGPGPDLYYFTAPRPLQLGAAVGVHGTVTTVRRAAAGAVAASITVLDKVHVEPLARPPARVVAPIWTDRVRATMARPLYRYQEEGAAWLASVLATGHGACLADEVGVGKSPQAIAALLATDSLPCLIVCPASITVNWTRELEFTARPLTVQILAGRSGDLWATDVTIVPYDLLGAREVQIARELRPRAIVFDECHALKHPRPGPRHRAAVATRLGAWVGRVILLTGTPILNRPKELWRLLHIAHPAAWPRLDDFIARYCQPVAAAQSGRRVITSAGRVERLDELQARVEPYLLRRLKRDVRQDLPPYSEHVRLVTLEPEDLVHYRAVERDVVAWLRAQGEAIRASAAARAASLTRLTYLRKLAALAKLRRALPEYLENWFGAAEPEPLVVFAHHQEVLTGLGAIAQSLGIRTAGISGKTRASGGARQAEIDRFQSGEADLFLASIGAGGQGINLFRAADCLFVERDFVPSRVIQGIGRLHRGGQLRPVTVTYLDAARTIDQRVAQVLAAKQILITTVLDKPAEAAAEAAVALAVAEDYATGPAEPEPAQS